MKLLIEIIDDKPFVHAEDCSREQVINGLCAFIAASVVCANHVGELSGIKDLGAKVMAQAQRELDRGDVEITKALVVNQ